MTCTKRAPSQSPPQGFTNESAKEHPLYKHLLGKGAQCERDAGHDPPHRNGTLTWHDPPLLLIAGAPPPPLSERELALIDGIGKSQA